MNMEIMSFRISTWEKGRQIAEKLGRELGLRQEERDSTIYLLDEDETIRISFAMDDRGFTFVKAKFPTPKAEDGITKLDSLKVDFLNKILKTSF